MVVVHMVTWNFAMQLLLLHKVSGVLLRVLNVHISSPTASDKRKKDSVNNDTRRYRWWFYTLLWEARMPENDAHLTGSIVP